MSVWILTIIAGIAALVSVVALYFSRSGNAALNTPIRRLYQSAAIERDNLYTFIQRDHDGRATLADRKLRAAKSGHLSGNTKSDVGDVVVYADYGLPEIVTIADSAKRAKTTYYLVSGREPYLVVRERAIKDASTPYVDRWYFEAGEYVVHRDSDPMQKQNVTSYSYVPDRPEDIANLKQELAAALASVDYPSV